MPQTRKNPLFLKLRVLKLAKRYRKPEALKQDLEKERSPLTPLQKLKARTKIKPVTNYVSTMKPKETEWLKKIHKEQQACIEDRKKVRDMTLEEKMIWIDEIQSMQEEGSSADDFDK